MEPVWIAVAVGGVVLLVVLLLLIGRGRERVIDVGGPADTASPAAATAAAVDNDDVAANAGGPGEILEFTGKDDAECGLADWLMVDVNRVLGSDFNKDRMVIKRVAEAALKASADLKASGRASIDLPYLAADAGGPKHYRRDVTRDEAEPGMVEHGALLVDELIQWRGRDDATVALAEWLQAEADEDAGSGSLDAASTVRVANAIEQAMADIARSGRAVVDLHGLTKDGGGAFNFRREFDRATLAELFGDV